MKELLEKYPKAAKIVKEYYLNKLLEGLKDKGLPEEFKDHVKQQGVSEEQIVKLLEVNPGALVDVFDENEIYISIFVDRTKPVGFRFTIFYNLDMGNNTPEPIYETRKQAEKEAIIESFKLLEEKL